MQERKIRNADYRDGDALSSNSIGLSGWEWIAVAIICLATFYFGPVIWGQLGELKSGPDYRLPYMLSSDYWLYDQLSRKACEHYDTVLTGDSVVWGHYVPSDGTLSHYLNENAGRNRFANLGVDGFHPAALWGLVKYYGRDISNKKVILHLNPLWMTSMKHDLQINKEFRFNHPKLVPQYPTRIPCYRASFSERASAVAERNSSFLSWASHLRIVYFDNMDLPLWTLDHPYRNPLGAITLELPISEYDDPQKHVSWQNRGISKQDFEWVGLYVSLQWRYFQKAVRLLQARNNTVFVLVGPFNEHMFKGKSQSTYDDIKAGIKSWLLQNNIPYFIPEALPSELYADASHPLSEGYAILAKQLFENQSFRSSILSDE